jgi:hypothetical protein
VIDFYLRQLGQFNGWTVVNPAQSPPDDYGDAYFGLVLTDGKQTKIVWFLRDDEGNGPGSFEVQDA